MNQRALMDDIKGICVDNIDFGSKHEKIKVVRQSIPCFPGNARSTGDGSLEICDFPVGKDAFEGRSAFLREKQGNRTYNIIKKSMSKPTEIKKRKDEDQCKDFLLIPNPNPKSPSKFTISCSTYNLPIKGCFSDLKEKSVKPLSFSMHSAGSCLSPVTDRTSQLKNIKTTRTDIRSRLEDYKQKINKINVMFFKETPSQNEEHGVVLQDISISESLQNDSEIDYNSEKNSESDFFETKSSNSKGSTQVSESKEDTFKVLTLNGQKEIFKIIRYINQGCYGKVYFVQHVVTNFICCLKVIKKEGLDEQMKNQIAREIKIQSYLSHPNIVAIYDFSHDEDNIYLLLEPCLGGNLFEKINKEDISEKEAARYVKQTSHALDFMHSEDIIHRDIKPENILIHQGTAKLCDFGWAVHAPILRDTRCGTPVYLSPQMIGEESYDSKIDVWAIGVLTYELLFKTIPFQIRSLNDLDKIKKEEIHFSEERIISEPAKDFIKKCLCKNPNQRINIVQALEHEFLSKDRLKL